MRFFLFRLSTLLFTANKTRENTTIYCTKTVLFVYTLQQNRNCTTPRETYNLVSSYRLLPSQQPISYRYIYVPK